MWEDPIVAEVHRVREELAAEFQFDVHAIFAELRKRQDASGARLIAQKPNAEAYGLGNAIPPEELGV
jgi:hypothetical protein